MCTAVQRVRCVCRGQQATPFPPPLGTAASGTLPLPTAPAAAVIVHAACAATPGSRDVVIPRGEVIDRRYRMTRDGTAVYVG